MSILSPKTFASPVEESQAPRTTGRGEASDGCGARHAFQSIQFGTKLGCMTGIECRKVSPYPTWGIRQSIFPKTTSHHSVSWDTPVWNACALIYFPKSGSFEPPLVAPPGSWQHGGPETIQTWHCMDTLISGIPSASRGRGVKPSNSTDDRSGCCGSPSGVFFEIPPC